MVFKNESNAFRNERTSWRGDGNQICKYVYTPLFTAFAQQSSGGQPKPDDDQIKRYRRELLNNDDRGVINSLSRATKSYCNCMKDKKTEANGMEKLERCLGCQHSFPRADTTKCSGCKYALFCTTDCHAKYWPAHKKHCQPLQKDEAKAAVREWKQKEQEVQKKTAR